MTNAGSIGGDLPHPASPRSRSPHGIATLPHVDDTVALGSRLGGQLRAGDVVVLSGPLGAGKTVLAKGIAEAMDVDGPVTSPTFVLARVHPPRRTDAPAMIHVDIYRLLDQTGADLLDALESLTSTPSSITPSWWWSGVKAWSSGCPTGTWMCAWNESATPTPGPRHGNGVNRE